jgi:transposase-like protein
VAPRPVTYRQVGTERHARLPAFQYSTQDEALQHQPDRAPHGEIKRRSDVAGIFPNEAAITRLIGAILLEQSDEWATQRALYLTLVTIGSVSDKPAVSLPAVAG